MTLETNLTAAFQAVGADMKGILAKTVGRIPYDCTVDGSGGFQQCPQTAAAAQVIRAAERDIYWHLTPTATLEATTTAPGYLDGVDGIVDGTRRVYFSVTTAATQTVAEYTPFFAWGTPDSDTLGMLDGELIRCPETGIYVVDWQIGFAPNTTGVRSAILKKRQAGNVDTTILDKAAVVHPTDWTIIAATSVLDLVKNEFIFWTTYQNSGIDLAIDRCHVRMVKVSV